VILERLVELGLEPELVSAETEAPGEESEGAEDAGEDGSKPRAPGATKSKTRARSKRNSN
jgi:hypothetical protein